MPEEVMTPQEFEEEMRNIFKGDDTEDEHFEADCLMCKLLESLGYDAGVEIFDEAHKWYA